MNILRSFFIVSSTTVIAMLSTQTLAANVDVVEGVDSAKCVLVTKESCTSSKSDSLKACTETHIEKAKKLDADTIMITDQKTSKHRKPSLAGGMKTVTITEVLANYYMCKSDTPVIENTSKNMSEKTIEERLNTLNTLKGKYLITEEEYSEKRQEILDDL